jgi:peptidoglycan/xylan/chitin deacetylase (PgdA/CDA1 family)
VTFDDGYRDNFTQAAPILKRYKVPAIYFVSTAALNRRELFWWDELAWILRETGVEHATLRGSALDLSTDGRQRLLNSLTEYCKRTDATTRRLLIQELRQGLKVDSVPHEIADSTLMTQEQVRTLIDYGISVGCHTVSHPCLARLCPEAQEEELQQSKTELESWTRRACLSVSYPFGEAEHFNASTKVIARKLGFRVGFSLIRGVNRLDCLDPWALCRILAPSDLDSFPLWFTFPRFMSFRQDRLDRKAKSPSDLDAPSRWEALTPTA